jgi:hypothetical protein
MPALSCGVRGAGARGGSSMLPAAARRLAARPAAASAAASAAARRFRVSAAADGADPFSAHQASVPLPDKPPRSLQSKGARAAAAPATADAESDAGGYTNWSEPPAVTPPPVRCCAAAALLPRCCCAAAHADRHATLQTRT